MSIKVRDLSTDEKARMKAGLEMLHAPETPDEPADEQARMAARLQRLRTEFADVAELIGCDGPVGDMGAADDATGANGPASSS